MSESRLPAGWLAGRPPKAAKRSFAESFNRAPQMSPTPPPSRPAKAAMTKPTVIKALPTIRDHTTDQLNAEGDEYIPRETDDAGEGKVTATGHPLGGREYRCRTFFVPNRGNKLFMLATECARVLGYRDSYLLFNKNRSLYKIIANQAEKDDLIHQEILPYSYRSRQITIVTARSMFRQFGSRLIVNGRRVRDDYWESKARKQGFTEEDSAGEKQPGTARLREAAAEANHHGQNLALSGYSGKINHQNYLSGATNPLQPVGGRTHYQDMTRPTSPSEILMQSIQTGGFMEQLEQMRKNRKQYLDDYWAPPHEPSALAERPGTTDANYVPQASQAVQSHVTSANVAVGAGQYGMAAQNPQSPGQAVGTQPYRAQPNRQATMVSSPMGQQQTPMRPDQMRRPPSIVMPQDTSVSICLPNAKCPNFIDPSLSGGNRSSSDGEQPHSITKQRSPSTEVTTITASSENGSLGDSSFDSDAEMNSNDRLLNPTRYFDGIKQLRQLVFQNSASKNRNSAAAHLPSDISDREILLRELRNLIVNCHRSLRSLQDKGFCGNFFSVLVLDRSRPTVAKLLPIEVAKVERLSALFKDIIVHFEEFRVKDLYAKTKSDPFATVLTSRLASACHDLLVPLQLIPTPSKPLSPAFLWTIAVHFLDLAVLSYVGTHTEDLDETYRDCSDGSLRIPGRFGAFCRTGLEHLTAGNTISVQKRKLQCLDQFLRHRSVWVFQNATTDSTYTRLYLSTDVNTLADIWGPLWKIKPDENSRILSRYDIGSGFIVPWDRKPESDPDLYPNGEGGMEVFCHWISSRDWDDAYVEQHQIEVLSKNFLETDRLLIGAGVTDRLAVNSRCEMSMERKLKIKQELKNAGNLRHRGTCRPRQEKGSQSFQIQASAAGFATLGTTMEYKRTEGFNIKDALLQRWRNRSRNIKYLEMWGGVEVSLCTKNARRIQLLHILRSQGLRRYLKTICFQWIDRECETAYFEALKDRRSFRKFWKEHPEWQLNIGDAINECFIALEETGVDERDDELLALWVEEFEDDTECEENNSGCNFVAAEEHLIILRRSEHNWTGMLKDSPECLTMAVAEDICLDCNDSNNFGMRCQGLRFSEDGKVARRFSPGYPVLQTAILINENLLEECFQRQLCYRTLSLKRKIAECVEEHDHAERGGKCERVMPHSASPAAYLMEYFGDTSRSWKGYWNTTNLSKGTKFSLGSHGHLKVLPRSTDGYPVLMEWQPVLNTLGRDLKVEIKERALGKSGDRHHSEYIEGAFWRSPLPCLILSSTKQDTKKENS